jgi:phage terminase Nu1 subunit (DNA packaging protein)
MALVNVRKLASVLNLTERRVQQLVPEGLPKEERGKYDLGKCMAWYIRYLQAALEKRAVPMPEGDLSGLRDERLRLTRAEAGLKEIELAKQRGLLVSIEDVEKDLAALIQEVKARIMAVGPRVAADLVGETSRVMVQAKLEKANKDALSLLAKYEPPADRN